MSAYFPLVQPNFLSTVPASFARDFEIYVRPRAEGATKEEVEAARAAILAADQQVTVYAAGEDGAAVLPQPLYTGRAGRAGEADEAGASTEIFAWTKGVDLPVDLWGRRKGSSDDDEWQVLPEGDQVVVVGGVVAEELEEKADIGTDGTVGGPGGSPLSPSVASGSSTKLFPVEGNDIAGAVAKIVANGSGILYVPDGHVVTVTTTTALPDEVTGLRVDGTVICTANVKIITRTGTVTGSSTNITAAIVAGSRTVSATPTDIAVGDVVFVASADTLPGTTDKLGYLRVIHSLTEGSVTFDSAIPRAMPSSTRRYRKITLAAPIHIDGHGTIGYADQTGTSSVFSFLWCREVTIGRELRIAEGGYDAVDIAHTLGFSVEATIDNFLDDLEHGHDGYGVNIEGACRDGYVGGRISRCRHAVTTNVGPSTVEFNFYGEPENIVIEPVTRACTDKAIAPHRAGWGITCTLNDKGSGGAIEVRCDSFVCLGGSVDSCFVGSAVYVPAEGESSGGLLTVPPVFGPIIATHCTSPVVNVNQGMPHFKDLKILAPKGTAGAIATTEGAGVQIDGGEIDSASVAESVGVKLAGTGSRIRGLAIKNCAIGYEETSTGSNNTVDAEYSGCTANVSRNKVTPTRKPSYHGHALSAHTRKVGGWIAPAAVSVATGALASGTLTFAAIDIEDGLTYSAVAAEVSTAGTGTLRLGLYYSGEDGLPGKLMHDYGTVTAVGTGVKEIAYESPELRGGRYWLAALSEASGLSVREQTCLGQFSAANAADVLAALKGSYFATGVATGAMPTTAPALTEAGAVTRLALKIASVKP